MTILATGKAKRLQHKEGLRTKKLHTRGCFRINYDGHSKLLGHVPDRATRRNQARADGWIREWGDIRNRAMAKAGNHVVPYPLRTTVPA